MFVGQKMRFGGMSMGKIKWLALGVVVMWLVWRIVVVNVSQHLAAENGAAALLWHRDNPDALLKQAADTAKANPERAQSLALAAMLQNPADGRAFLIMALLWEQEGKLAQAEQAARLADFLAPRRSEPQLQLGNFWARRGNAAEALPHWRRAIEMRDELRNSLFPLMLRLADAPPARPAFAGILNDPPLWWPSFFLYALNNAAHKETLKALYLARANSPGGAEHVERRAYIDHLMHTGMWTDAYFVWLNGLNANQLSALGNINNGGFEHEIADEGFGWRPATGDGFALLAEPTYGCNGEKALHVSLMGQPSRHPLAHQYLMLDPGQYRLQGRVRLDSLSAGKGLLWVVACVNESGSSVLSRSEHFLGADHWKGFASDLVVPAQCTTQKLSLEIDRGTDSQTDYGGAAFFDDLAIKRLD